MKDIYERAARAMASTLVHPKRHLKLEVLSFIVARLQRRPRRVA